MLASPPNNTPDAVIAPRPFLPNGREPHGFFNAKFRNVMEVPPGELMHVRSQGNQYFMTADPDDSVLFPVLHDLASTERYHWFVVAADRTLTYLATPEPVRSWRDRPEAVKFGWLVDPDTVQPPGLDVKADFMRATQAKALAWKRFATRFRELDARKDSLWGTERQEYIDLRREIDAMAAEGPVPSAEPPPPDAPESLRPEPGARDGAVPAAVPTEGVTTGGGELPPAQGPPPGQAAAAPPEPRRPPQGQNPSDQSFGSADPKLDPGRQGQQGQQ